MQLEIGELNLSVNGPNEAMKLYGGLHCHVKVCGGLDEMSHIQNCFGYSSRLKGDGNEEAMAEYLLELHKERVKKFGISLMYIKADICY